VKNVILLAAGKSSRFGRNKLEERFGGLTLPQRAAMFAQANGCENLYVTLSRSAVKTDGDRVYHPILEDIRAIEIEPKIAPYNDLLNKKMMASPFVNELDQAKYFIYLRGIKQEMAIFREENVPLQAKVAATSQKYGTIIGSLMVEMEGKELTLQQASNYLKNTEAFL
jgi:hypothetical protein